MVILFSKRLKVIMVSPGYFPQIGGVETHVKQIAERMAPSVEVEVFTLDHSQTENMVTESVNGVLVRRFKSRRIAYGIEFPPREFVNAILESKADIVHLHNLQTLLPKYIMKAVEILGCKLVVTCHYHGSAHTFLRNILLSFYKPFLTRVVKRADSLFCVSEYEKGLVLRDFAASPDKISVIPNGIELDSTLLPAASQSKTGRQILFVGRLEKYKNVVKLVESISLLPNEWKLTVVGDGPETRRIEGVSKALRLEQRVILKRNLSRADLVKEYQNADLFVMPSSHEAYGIAVAEALSLKLRTLVADTSALSDFVSGSYAYPISLPLTPDSIASSILAASAKSPRDFKEYPVYSWEMVAERTKGVYSQILSSPNVLLDS